MPNPLATWNPERDCWETGVEDIFGHSDVYSETWPTSGMTRNGVAYALPTWAPPTTASACSSSPPAEMFRTPAAAEAEGGALSPERARVENRTLRLTGQILDMVAPEQMSDAWKAFKTPTSQLAVNGGSQHPDKRKAGGHGPTLADEVEHLLPTPVAQPSGNTPEEHLRKKPGRTRVTDLAILTENGLIPTGGALLPTPQAADGTGGRMDREIGGTRASGAKRAISLPTVAALTLAPTGAPTPPPSTDGNPSWEDVPLPLPSSPNAESTGFPPASPNG